MENIQNCPVCNDIKQQEFLICKDYLYSQENFTICQCMNCGFKFTNPRPEQNVLGNYYKSEEYLSHNEEKKSVLNSIYKTVKKHTLNKKLDLINKLTKGKNILDIGCGTGAFLDVCKNNGWNVFGIEPSNDARNFAKTNYKIETVFEESEISKFENEKFDIITMWHVLEHVPELNQRVQELNRMLKPNGTLIIAVPNSDSYDAKHYKSHWAAFDVPRHLYHFNTKTITQLLEKHKLKIEQILPMKFDSYYVALLSEKYKKNPLAPVSALIFGFISNLLASKKSYGHSSLIYVIKKL
jgi:2-polyprenyl-3-methyl-5-hydroxy-6-metoxy-1,4-benzoquinol methylase